MKCRWSAVTAAGETFIVGLYEYHAFHEPLQYAVFVRVNGDGVVLDSTPINFSFGFVGQLTGATYGDTAILTWAQFKTHDSSASTIEAVLVNGDGSHRSKFGVSNGSGEFPAIAAQGDPVRRDDPGSQRIHRDEVAGTRRSYHGQVTTFVGNVLLPAGRWVVANDGAVMFDHYALFRSWIRKNSVRNGEGS